MGELVGWRVLGKGVCCVGVVMVVVLIDEGRLLRIAGSGKDFELAPTVMVFIRACDQDSRSRLLTWRK